MQRTHLRAVVVGSVDIGEANRIVRLLSETEGRSAVLVRGARKASKRHGGALEPGCHLEIERKRSRGDLPVLADVQVLSAPKRAREELIRVAMLLYGCEVCATLAPEHAPAEKLYRLLVAWLALMEGKATPGVCSRLALEAKALTFGGFCPHLLKCPKCGEELADPVAFSNEAGGGVHRSCGSGAAATTLGLSRLEGLRWTPLSDTAPLEEWPHEPWLLTDFLQYQLGRALRSLSFLRQVETH